jgi:hypothetical protein
MQTKDTGGSKPSEVSTSGDVRQRPPTSGGSRLIDRLDLAMRRVGVSGADLARVLGIKPQNITNMRRKTGDGGDGLRVAHVARAAEFLRSDLFWLCTGEGGEYVAAGGAPLSEFARDIANWIDALSPDKRAQFIRIAWELTRDRWPAVSDDPTRPAR